jgi:hypothetical protein
MVLDDTGDALKLDDTESAVVDQKNDRPTRPVALPPRTRNGVDPGRVAPNADQLPDASDEGPFTTLLSQSGRPNCMRPRAAKRTFPGPIEGEIRVIVSRSGQNSGP